MSEHLFGSQHFLPVASCIRRRGGERFYQHQIAVALGCDDQRVMGQLKRLRALDLVTDVGRGEGDRQKWLQATDHPLWGVIDAACALIAPVGPPD